MKKRLRKKSKRLMCSHRHEGEEYCTYWSCVFSNGDRDCSICKMYSLSIKDRRSFYAARKRRKKYYKRYCKNHLKYFGD